ncbi:hypothetical protein DPMN_152044 [Dreissena polymorpha]|uniref:Uncharacterized protein n=1 Tax=Dreissena polymorpha TaxID=45954 RepID=A0A9D4FGR4_DREPO|nr:hypothetical protein DPMN_152044 [Dreissena polymorpha]
MAVDSMRVCGSLFFAGGGFDASDCVVCVGDGGFTSGGAFGAGGGVMPGSGGFSAQDSGIGTAGLTGRWETGGSTEDWGKTLEAVGVAPLLVQEATKL